MPRYGTGARYGESVSISSRSSGTRRATSCTSVAFLNVTMPDSEIWKFCASACSATGHGSVKQCITPPGTSARSSAMIRSVSSDDERVWMISGFIVAVAARICVRKRSRCHSMSAIERPSRR